MKSQDEVTKEASEKAVRMWTYGRSAPAYHARLLAKSLGCPRFAEDEDLGMAFPISAMCPVL